jgi:anti-sigma B factor antagonist
MRTYSIKTEQKNDVNIIYLSGDIDLSNSPVLRKKLNELLNHSSNILVDLSSVSYMDSSGLATLVEAMQKTARTNGKFKISGLKGEVKNIFEIARLNDVFSIYDTTDTAVKSFKPA